MERVKEWLSQNRSSGVNDVDYLSYGFDNGCGYGFGSRKNGGFVSGNGYGYGNNDGSGHISRWGDGCGFGPGSGGDDCCGFGSDSGSFNGSNYGIKTLNGEIVYMVDGVPTIIRRIAGNLAKGAIVSEKDFSLIPCYIVRGDGYFAHGETAAEAARALTEKILEGKSVEERIDEFVKRFPSGVKAPGRDFFEWHHILTGSCKMGRDAFVREHSIDLEAEYTPQEFIDICKNAYGGNIISKLRKRYEQ